MQTMPLQPARAADAGRPAAPRPARLNWPRGIVVTLTAVAIFLPLGADLLPELPERAVLHADQGVGLDAYRVHLRRLAISGRRSRTGLILAAGLALIAVPLGGMLAFLMVRTDLPGRGWIEPLLLVPIFVSPMVLAFGYVVSAGPVGFYSVWASSCSACVPWNVYSLTSIVDHRRPDARAARVPVRVVGAEEPRLRRRGSRARGRRLAVAGRAATCQPADDHAGAAVSPACWCSSSASRCSACRWCWAIPKATWCCRPICTSSPTSSARRRIT